MHDRLFQGQDLGEWRQGTSDDLRTFVGYAEAIGLDTAAFTSCIENNQTADQIEADAAQGSREGVRSTPTFVVNGKLIVGAQSFSTWQRVLEQMLAEQ